MLRVLGLSLAAATVMTGLAAADSTAGMIRKDVPVYYHDLNLNTEAGARVMLVRIAVAAKEACGVSPNFYSYSSTAPALAQHEFAKCQADAVRRTVISLKAPIVTRLYAENSSAQAPSLASY